MGDSGPPEPDYPPDRKPHSERIREIARLCPVWKTALVVMDDTPEHRAYYLYHLKKYKDITILDQFEVEPGMYAIKITKTMVN
jgi:hypothetical protein